MNPSARKDPRPWGDRHPELYALIAFVLFALLLWGCEQITGPPPPCQPQPKCELYDGWAGPGTGG